VPLPDNILSALVRAPVNERLAQAYIQPVDLAPDERPPWSTSEQTSLPIAFQYWPESIQDSRGSEWSPRNIPGGSHPIYQWTHGGERRVSFTAIFTTDTAPDNYVREAAANIQSDIEGGTLVAGQLQSADPYADQSDRLLGGIQRGTRDLDIRSAIAWLRWFTYPTYSLGSEPRAYEPAKSLLVLPGSGIAHNGRDSILTVMTQCDVTYEAFFPNGFPRIVEVQLEFAEVVQESTRVRFHDRKDMVLTSYIRGYLGLRNSQPGNSGSSSATGITRGR